jgi:hypothetical protein
MPATDTVTDTPNVPLPPEAGDVNAPRFEPNEDWLRRAAPDQQKAAMWRWFATRYEEPAHPETSAPQDAQGRRVHDDDEGPFHADEVLHARFDELVPREVVDDLVQGVQQAAGNDWARRGVDEFGG